MLRVVFGSISLAPENSSTFSAAAWASPQKGEVTVKAGSQSPFRIDFSIPGGVRGGAIRDYSF